MFKKRKTLSVAIQLACSGAVVTGIALGGIASAEEAVKLEKEQVTGSHIKQVDIEAAQPLIVIDKEDIQNRGFVTVQDVLNSLTQNASGSLTQQSIHGFTPAASGFDLRGAGLGRVLTLIDGKRVSKYPLAAGAEINFVDTANIPIGAIERIEILAGGASAIYGSDAMGGVVNIIMRKDFDGITATVYESITDDGGRDVHRQSGLFGTTGDWGNVTLFLEHEKREQLKATDRKGFDIGTDLAFGNPFSSYSSYGISLRNSTGTVVNTINPEECADRGLQFWDYSNSVAGGVCGFDRTSMRDLLPEQERTSFMGSFSYNITDNHELYGRVDYTQSDVTTKIEPMPVNDYNYMVEGGRVTLQGLNGAGEIVDSVTFDQAIAFGGDFAGLSDGTYNYTRRMLEFGHRTNNSDITNKGILLGVRGMLSEVFDYDFTYNWSDQEVYSKQTGYATVQGYFDYLASGVSGRSQFDVMAPDEVKLASYRPWSRGTSSFTGYSFGVTGDVYEMPAGALSIAAGVEYFEEEFKGTSDEASRNFEILATGGGNQGSGDRNSTGIYLEALVPVLDELVVKPAVRFDDYSDMGSHTSPQIGVEYRPVETLLLRGNYSDTFRAPDMIRMYGDQILGFAQITDPKGCMDAGGTIDPNSPIDACNGELYVNVFGGANPDLEPETGSNWSVGVVYEYDELDISLDYWEVEVEDIVNTLGAQTIATDYDVYGNLITRDPATGFVESIDERPQNLSWMQTKGIDLAAGYSFDLNSYGELRLDLSMTYLLDYEEQKSPTSNIDDMIEISNVPELRANLATTWSWNDFSTTLFIEHIGSMNGVNKSDMIDWGYGDYLEENYSLEIDSYTTANLTVKYDINDMFTVRGGVNNLTNEGPNPDWTDYGWPHYPREYYGPVGREYFLTIDANF